MSIVHRLGFALAVLHCFLCCNGFRSSVKSNLYALKVEKSGPSPAVPIVQPAGSEGSETKKEERVEALSNNLFEELGKKLRVPLVALAIGIVMAVARKCNIIASGFQRLEILLMYFGAQGSMALAVKSIMAYVPLPFLFIFMQQCVAFVLYMLIIFGSRLTSKPYAPRALSSWKDYGAVFLFGAAFAVNVALNTFGISLIPLAMNLVIRSCMPLATAITMLVGRALGVVDGKRNTSVEILLMTFGVYCAIVTVYASQSASGKAAADNSFGVMIGALACTGSLFSGALNIVLASVLGSRLKMTPLDSSGFMSVPAAVSLIAPILLLTKPVSADMMPGVYPNPATDIELFWKILEVKPSLLLLPLGFGPIAFAYNVLQWKLVQTLSAPTTAFAGNFNKAASIGIALFAGVDKLPAGYFAEGIFSPTGMFGRFELSCAVVYASAVAGNILSFTAFSLLQAYSKRKTAKAAENAKAELLKAEAEVKPEEQAPEELEEPFRSFVGIASFLDPLEEQEGEDVMLAANSSMKEPEPLPSRA